MIFSHETEHHLVLVACKVEFINLKPFSCHMNSVHEYVAVNSGEATNPNTQHSQKTWLLFLWMKEKQALSLTPKVVRRHQRWSIAWLVLRLHQWIKMKLLRKHLMAAPIRLKLDCWHFKWSWAFCSSFCETITLPSTPSQSKTECNQQWRPTGLLPPTLLLALLAVILIFFPRLPLSFLPLPFFLSIFLSLLLSRSECLHFLQQTASRGTRVYFATCGDGSLPRQELAASCCWFLTCVHPFTSTAVRSSLLPPEDPQGFSPFKGHVEPFDIMCFIGLQGAVGVLFETVRKYNKSTKTTLGLLSGTYISAQTECRTGDKTVH